MQDFSLSLPMRLYRALDAVMPSFRAIFGQSGLTEQQWRILRVLWEHETITPRELSGLTLIPNPSLVGIIDRLSANGLVTRKPSTADRRSVLIQATKKGHNLEHQVTPLVNQLYKDLQHSVEPQVWTALVNGLDQITNAQTTNQTTNKVQQKRSTG